MSALLPLACFLIFFLSNKLPLRESFLMAAILWGVAVLLISETLSVLHWLSFPGIFLSWLLVFVAAIYLAMRQGYWKSIQWVKFTKEEFLLLGLGSLLCALMAVVAFWAPPNNWDSLTTHMARVAHWVQDKTLDNYPTTMLRQLNYPPWAAYAIMHFQILTQTDRLANFIQYFSMLGSLIGASLIAAQLGANRLVQIVTSIVTLTIPMGILQASSTQNDYVVTFWLICFINFCLLLRNQFRWAFVFAAGASLGLSWLIKGTGYIYALPFLIWLFCFGCKKYGLNFITKILVILGIAMTLNLGYLSRNLGLTGTLIPPSEKMNIIDLEDSADFFLSNVIRNLALQMGTPVARWNRNIELMVYQAHEWIDKEVEDSKGNMQGARFSFADLPFHEDHASNFIHLILIFVSGVMLIFLRKTPNYSYLWGYFWMITAGFVLFNMIVKWSPYNNRYHLPLFVLYAPFISIVLSNLINKRFIIVFSLSLMVFALPWVLMNKSRPLLGSQSILKIPRQEQYFVNNPGYIFSYLSAIDVARQANCSEIGLILGGDTWEYPLWAAAKESYQNQGFRLEHVDVKNESSQVKYPLGSFNPCVILNSDTAEKLAVVINHKPYIKLHQYAFFSTYFRFDFLPLDFQKEILSKINPN